MKLKENRSTIQTLVTLVSLTLGVLLVLWATYGTFANYQPVPSESFVEADNYLAGFFINLIASIGGVLVVYAVDNVVVLNYSQIIRVIKYPIGAIVSVLIQLAYIAYLRSYGVSEMLPYFDWIVQALLVGTVATVLFSMKVYIFKRFDKQGESESAN